MPKHLQCSVNIQRCVSDISRASAAASEGSSAFRCRLRSLAFKDVVLIDTMTDKDLVRKTFLRAAWGPTPENLRELREFEEEVLGGRRAANLHQKFIEARANGEQAHTLSKELERVFRRDGETVARNWIKDRTTSLDASIHKHLDLSLDGPKGLIVRERTLTARRQQAQYKSKVETALVDGEHPNSLRGQKPSINWNIFIDETGSIFDETARELSSLDQSVGKIVAVAIPAEVILEPADGFHARDSTFEQVDTMLQRVLEAPVGILGLNVQDQTARHRYWIGHVLHLIRWTLLQLPVPVGNVGCKIQIYIEKRGRFDERTNLDVVREALEGEMRVLDPERYNSLELDLRVMGKDHPMDGYVDAVAFTWGSPAPASKDRLEKSLLRGHCLIDANETSLHHLYLALSQHGPLAPGDWYTLCAAATNDPKESFLSRAIERLGNELQQHPGQWQRYLAEVQLRLHSKQYFLPELGQAISWLQRHAEKTQKLPGVLQLQLSSSNLALANHQGQISQELIGSCLEWVNQLHDEAPQLACEAILRMTSTLTNNFEFSALEHVVDNWLDKPVAIAGLLNYGKLQSTKGQLLAFQGEARQSLPHFEKAISSFDRLSDRTQAKREIRQTRNYRLIALMDTALMQSAECEIYEATPLVLAEMTTHLGDREPEFISRFIARSTHDERFDHHLWLRAMTYFPNELIESRQIYLKQSTEWQEGQDHPWPLISAYRAWMLHDSGNMTAAQQEIESAIFKCENVDHGPTLMWMAEVLRTLAVALGLDPGNKHSSIAQREHLKKRLPKAPHAALSAFKHAVSGQPISHADILAHLAACLPYNFH